MLVLARIAAVVAAAVIYYVLCTLVWFGVLVVATWRGHNLGYDVGYEETPRWEWLVLVAWFIGLPAVAWWAGFRAPWWRRRGRSGRSAGGPANFANPS
jgi:hypothetical protein